MVEFGGIYNMYLRHICFVFINYFCSSLIKHTNELVFYITSIGTTINSSLLQHVTTIVHSHLYNQTLGALCPNFTV